MGRECGRHVPFATDPSEVTHSLGFNDLKDFCISPRLWPKEVSLKLLQDWSKPYDPLEMMRDVAVLGVDGLRAEESFGIFSR